MAAPFLKQEKKNTKVEPVCGCGSKQAKSTQFAQVSKQKSKKPFYPARNPKQLYRAPT
jgi:hypothetical protein